jgi:hypothetical protein
LEHKAEWLVWTTSLLIMIYLYASSLADLAKQVVQSSFIAMSLKLLIDYRAIKLLNGKKPEPQSSP